MAQLNNWSCLPAAFAKGMGTTLDYMTELIGHDGSQIVWPGYPPPTDRRSFHIQEILHAVAMMSWSAMPVGPNPRLSNGRGPYIEIKDEFFEKAKLRLGVHLGVTDTGINHAVTYIPLCGFWCPSQEKWIKTFHTKEIWLLNKCS